eukprot:3748517-Lingulodinium_polyedra.AAC.1
MLVWWLVPDNIPHDVQSMSIYHAGTRLGDNRAGLLVDTGVWGHLSGDVWVHEQALLSKEAGYMPSQAKLDTP